MEASFTIDITADDDTSPVTFTAHFSHGGFAHAFGFKHQIELDEITFDKAGLNAAQFAKALYLIESGDLEQKAFDSL